MHWECLNFVERMKRLRPEVFCGKRVLEIGSFNINGGVRHLFEDCRYVGIDWRQGPGVDKVCFGHQWDHAVDVVVCTNTLEHDKHWRSTLERMKKIYRLAVIVTVPSFDYTKHRVEAGVKGYYRNMQPEDLREFFPSPTVWEEDRVTQELRMMHVQ